MAHKLINLTCILIMLVTGCGASPTSEPQDCVVASSNDSTLPTLGLTITDFDKLKVDLNETSQPMLIEPIPNVVSVYAGATDDDGGIKVVNLWATYTYYKPGQTSGPFLAGAPIQQVISDGAIGECVRKNMFFFYRLDLKKELGNWSSIQIDVWVAGENFQGGKIQTPKASITYPPESIIDGKLYREFASQDIYYISSEKKIRIPTDDALAVMGYSTSDVKVVGVGALNNHTRFDIPSSSPTPGSLVFPPNRKTHFPLQGMPNATRMFSQGKEIQLVELYGWLRKVQGCNPEPKPGTDPRYFTGADLTYELELDTEWALSQGIDLNKILRVGNGPKTGIPGKPGVSPRKWFGLPLVHVELNSWKWRDEVPPGIQIPPIDWTTPYSCGEGKTVLWPFNPYRPKAGGPEISETGDKQIDPKTRGLYVRMAGSLVTDSPHDHGSPAGVFSEYFAITCPQVWSGEFPFKIPCDAWDAEWDGAISDWNPGVDENGPNHYARWTELHPPDLIEVIDKNDPRYREPNVTTRALMLVARDPATPVISACEEAEADIYPEAERPITNDAQLAYEELRGPETYFPWGENSDNGSWITVFDDHIHVKARVCGRASLTEPRLTGRFKAIYRVWWAGPRALYLSDGIGGYLDRIQPVRVAVGLFKDIHVNLSNRGYKPVTITGFRVEGDPTGALGSFSYPQPFVIEPRVISGFSFRFQPSQPGPFEATIVVLSDEPGHRELRLPFVAPVDPAPFYITPSDALEFGSVVRGTSKSMDIEIGNNSDTTKINVGVTMESPDGQFSPSAESSGSQEISPRTSKKLQIVYTPRLSANATAVLMLNISLGNGETVERKILLHGKGVSPVIVLDPTSLDFGALVPGSSKRLTINILNTGDADLTVSGYTALQGDSSVFSFDSLQFPLQIAPHQRTQFGVTFSHNALPGQVMFYVIEFSSNDPDSPKTRLEMRGSSAGVRLIATDFISFQNPQPTDTKTIEIENLGDVPATIDQIKFDNGTVFELVSPPQFPITINPGQKVTITIGLKSPLPTPAPTPRPSGPYYFSDNLYLYTNDSQHPIINVGLALSE